MHTALALSANIKGMSTLVVGTAECGTYSRNIIAKTHVKEDTFHWMYILDANEVVFGCRKGLIDAIKEMDRAGAGALMIILTCVPEVIGEDIEGIIHEIQPRINAKLSFVQMGHFKCNSHPSGYWKTLLAFGGLMEASKTNPHIINILGRSPHEDHIPVPELLPLLEEKGFTLRMLAPKSDLQDFVKAPGGRLNIVLSPFMNPLAEFMKDKFNIPFISFHEYYAISEIDKIYEDISKELDIDLKKALNENREEALFLENKAKEIFNGLKYIATHRNSLMPIPLAIYISSLGMEPILLHIEEFYPDDKKWAKALKEKGYNPLICHMVNEVSDAPLLESLDVDFSFGEIPYGTGKIPALKYMYEFYGQMGYERTSKLISRILKVAEESKTDSERGERIGAS
ncbi:nitrogenase component 1 [Anaeropeptidivorans aminofermentans]|uniref:nitrogenase component 1 n=1 Tax=Anaeropeptidivorans aminofermentans TaxID=2934315 RepID=UPI002ECFBBD4